VAGISRGAVEAFDPPVISLHWSFMNDLPGNELARVYAWYQQMLNLEADELFEQAGTEFLPALRQHLPWDRASDWTTDMLLPLLAEVNPHFQDWEQRLTDTYGR
jgi:hypothetical protein